MTDTTLREQMYRRWKKGEDYCVLAKKMGVTRERMRIMLKKMDTEVPLVDRIEALEDKLEKALAVVEITATYREKCHHYDKYMGCELRAFDEKDIEKLEIIASAMLAALTGAKT